MHNENSLNNSIQQEYSRKLSVLPVHRKAKHELRMHMEFIFQQCFGVSGEHQPRRLSAAELLGVISILTDKNSNSNQQSKTPCRILEKTQPQGDDKTSVWSRCKRPANEGSQQYHWLCEHVKVKQHAQKCNTTNRNQYYAVSSNSSSVDD